MNCHRRTPRSHSLPLILLTVLVLVMLVTGTATAQGELSYRQYRALAWAADRMDHLAMFEPLHGEQGMYLAIGERFGTVQVFKYDGSTVNRVWKSIHLSGIPEELLVADLDSDGFDDALLCRTSGAKIYVWRLEDFSLIWESLSGEYQVIGGYTTANVDDGPEAEIVLLADHRITYVDGVTFNRKFTTTSEYTATMVRCGDVDGDGRVEIVLNSGQVVDSVTGEIEWEDEPFFGRIELLDIDGDGMPEVLTESELGGPLRVYDVDFRSEVRFQ